MAGRGSRKKGRRGWKRKGKRRGGLSGAYVEERGPGGQVTFLAGLGSAPAVHRANFVHASSQVDRAFSDMERAMRAGDCVTASSRQATLMEWVGRAKEAWSSLPRTPVGNERQRYFKMLARERAARFVFPRCVNTRVIAPARQWEAPVLVPEPPRGPQVFLLPPRG